MRSHHGRVSRRACAPHSAGVILSAAKDPYLSAAADEDAAPSQAQDDTLRVKVCNALRPTVFRLPKAGSSQREYEDAVAWSRRAPRYAVADGASASAFARLWAHLLAHAYSGGHLRADHLEDDLATVQARWASLVERRRLPWYAQEQVRRGAFAALVGLDLRPDGRWAALAVGDCCLFQVRQGALIAAFPLDSAADFSQRPLLLGSRAAANAGLRRAGAIGTAGGDWRSGDVFLLMSDALAGTFLERCQADPAAALAALDFVPTASGFRAWVNGLRAERHLRNDDVSLVWVQVGADATA